MSVDLRAMFILCSPLEAECPRMKMLQRRSSITNLPYFSILELGTVCAPCSLAKEPVCPHLYDNRPAWKSTKTEQMLRDLMSDRTFRTEVLFFYLIMHMKGIFFFMYEKFIKGTYIIDKYNALHTLFHMYMPKYEGYPFGTLFIYNVCTIHNLAYTYVYVKV